MNPRRTVLIGIAAALALGGLAAFFLLPHEASAPKTPILTVDSQPSGARVKIDGAEVGQTPYYSDNRYAAGPVKLQLSLKGYRDWNGTFDGGEEAVVSVALVKAGPLIALEKMSVSVKPAEVPDAGPQGDWHDPDLDNDPK